MKKILVIGTIDDTHTNISGQYDRTEIIRDGLIARGYTVDFVNMFDWKKYPATVFVSISKKYFHADTVIFLASLNGTKVILNLLSFLKIFQDKQVFQIAIGGQSNFRFVQSSKWYRKKVGELDAIFVEIASMVDDYKTVGLDNVFYLPNCKKVQIDEKVVNNPSLGAPYRFCTYSRVTPEKGIAEAIEVVEKLNKKHNGNYCTLDIYGTFLQEDKAWFEKLMEKASSSIRYNGRIDRKDSIEVLSKYDLMLFPTKHSGEGVPGGMIDCYEAGLPIVTCNTSYMNRIIHNEKTGFVYEGDSSDGLENAILQYTEGFESSKKRELRVNCQEEARRYDTDSVITSLIMTINGINKLEV